MQQRFLHCADQWIWRVIFTVCMLQKNPGSWFWLVWRAWFWTWPWSHPEPGGTMPMRSFWNIALERTEHVISFDVLVSCTLWAANIKNQECLLNKWLFSDRSEWFSLLQLQGLHPVARLCRRSWSTLWCSQVWGFHYRIRDWARTLLAVCVSIFNLLYMV